MRAGQRLQPGHLMTGEERRILKDVQTDLERQLRRAGTAGRIADLEGQLGSVERERKEDRETRRSLPRKPKGKRGHR